MTVDAAAPPQRTATAVVGLRALRASDLGFLDAALAESAARLPWPAVVDALNGGGNDSAPGAGAWIATRGLVAEPFALITIAPPDALACPPCLGARAGQELGFWTRPRARGLGLTHRAVAAVLVQRRGELPVDDDGWVFAHADPANTASIAILDRLSRSRRLHDGVACFDLGGTSCSVA